MFLHCILTAEDIVKRLSRAGSPICEDPAAIDPAGDLQGSPFDTEGRSFYYISVYVSDSTTQFLSYKMCYDGNKRMCEISNK